MRGLGILCGMDFRTLSSSIPVPAHLFADASPPEREVHRIDADGGVGVCGGGGGEVLGSSSTVWRLLTDINML